MPLSVEEVSAEQGWGYAGSGPILPATTVASLPSAASAGVGRMRLVTDATLSAITGLGLAPVGGGANIVPVYSTGSAWVLL